MTKVFNIIIVILDVLLIALLSVIKISYYIDIDMYRFDTAFNTGYALIWTPISMLITLSPMLAQIIIIAFVTFIELSQRKIPIQHSGKGGGQTQSMAKASFLPIKINSAGVIPVIFASSIMTAPSIITAFVGGDTNAEWLKVFSSSQMTNMR